MQGHEATGLMVSFAARRRYVARLNRVRQVEQIGSGEQKTASSACSAVVRTREADAAHVADVDDLAMAEAGRAQIDLILLRQVERASLLYAR